MNTGCIASPAPPSGLILAVPVVSDNGTYVRQPWAASRYGLANAAKHGNLSYWSIIP
jgi:hypothetical protein